MFDAILSLLGGGNGLLLGLGAVLVAVTAAFFKGRLSGAAKERAKQAEAEQKARTIADEVENDVGSLPGSAAREELREWSRK